MISRSRIFLTLVLSAVLFASPASGAPSSAASTQAKITQILQTYLQERGSIERITAGSVAITNLQGTTPIVAAVGATPANLFQIGSNTKAFTAVLALQLEAAGRLNLDAPIGQWLPQYPAWKNVTIRHMLDMTSGIQTYDNTRTFQRAYAENPYKNFSAAELVSYVYPSRGRAAFLPGWNYSNTGYILTQMILERVTGQSYANLLRTRLFTPFHLNDVFYDPNVLPATVQGRVVAGYFFSNDPDNAGLSLLYNHNVRNFSLSWTQAAGGIVTTPTALTRWVRVLYSATVLPEKQRAELRSVVSMKTGMPIANATPAEPRTFGLGVGEMYRAPLGRFWFYEGETLGYRVVHVYAPQRNLVMAVALNSQPNAKEDHIGVLVDRIVAVLPAR